MIIQFVIHACARQKSIRMRFIGDSSVLDLACLSNLAGYFDLLSPPIPSLSSRFFAARSWLKKSRKLPGRLCAHQRSSRITMPEVPHRATSVRRRELNVKERGMSWQAVLPGVCRAKAIRRFVSRDRGMRCAALAVLWVAAVALPRVHFAAAEVIAVVEAANDADMTEDFGIFVMKIDGSEERKIVEVAGFARHASPRWSHDGRQLAFEASEGPNDAANFYIVNLDGTQLQELAEYASPDWSP